MTTTGGYGAVTTYGNTGNPETSAGGACNYGSTQILNYAAAHVDVVPGDKAGLWQGGQACGDCYRVQVGSSEGWQTTIVRIVDKCPDAWCGIDLGGTPAQSLMGNKPGRYTGKWERVSCVGTINTSDGPAQLHTKDGTNQWWSLVQVRNGPSATGSITYTLQSTGATGALTWATEAENYWKVPTEVLSAADTVELDIHFRTGETTVLQLPTSALAIPDTSFILP